MRPETLPHAPMTIPRATFAEIHLDRFRDNLLAIRTDLSPDVKILAVVKADAYGHGAVACAKTAVDAGADYLGISILEEGIELRQNGITSPILVLGGIFENEIEEFLQHNLSTVLSTSNMAHSLAKEAEKSGKTVGVHIKVDTGMGRLGVLPENFLPLVEQIRQHKNLHIEAVSTHFSSADDEDPGYTLFQLSRFNEILAQLKTAGIQIPLIHCANSAALLKFPQSWFNMVRPGLILYGALPSPTIKPYVTTLDAKKFYPVMQWKSRIIQINHIPKEHYLSYGRKHMTQKESLIATLPVGYADGLTRRLSGKMSVLIHGKRLPQVGNICMDMCLIDITEVPDAQVGDEAVIFGSQLEETITVEEVAEQCGTLPYEILCAVSKRVPRVYFPAV